MIRFLVLSILATFVLRALARFWRGLLEGLNGSPGPRPNAGVPQCGVAMVRDPVCGTFVVPTTAVTLTVGRQVLHFCSTTCRDRYRAEASSTSVQGRTA